MGYDEYIYKGATGEEGEKVNIDLEHHEIHEGNHYTYANIVGPLAVSAMTDFIMEIPTGSAAIHMTGEVTMELGTKLEVFEGASYSAFGTTVTAINSNRRSTNTTVVKLGVGPTLVTTGTALLRSQFGARARGGFVDRGEELILDEGQKYLLRVISLFASNTGSVVLNFYEYE